MIKLTLLEKLELAVKNKSICSPFTTEDFKNWINKFNVINDKTGAKYADSYIENFLSSSTVGGSSTKTDKALIQSTDNPKHYSFVDDNDN